MKNIKNHWEDVYTDVRVQSVEDYIAMKIMERNQVMILITFEPITTGFNRVTHPVSYIYTARWGIVHKPEQGEKSMDCAQVPALINWW